MSNKQSIRLSRILHRRTQYKRVMADSYSQTNRRQNLGSKKKPPFLLKAIADKLRHFITNAGESAMRILLIRNLPNLDGCILRTRQSRPRWIRHPLPLALSPLKPTKSLRGMAAGALAEFHEIVGNNDAARGRRKISCGGARH